ncbi:MAG: putative toxin-antitoxin system toxin component, PIN family [Bryobacteraceae bacterium]
MAIDAISHVIDSPSRVVLDTDVMVSALRSTSGASYQLLLCAFRREIEALVSVPLMMEYEAVLTRPEHVASSGSSLQEVENILAVMANKLTPVWFGFMWRPCLRDPADEMVLETAINGDADALVTFNERHLATAARTFGVRVMKPRDCFKEALRRR